MMVDSLEPKSATTNLYYIYDPMCSWCWAFRPVWEAIKTQLPPSIKLHNVLGGLAPDSHQPMPAEMQSSLRETWQRISVDVPTTSFNFDFWEICSPRRSTYPACRAIVAAKKQNEEFEASMLHAIQLAYYQQARNPSDDTTLCELADEIGLDKIQFSSDLNAAETQAELRKQIHFARKIGGNSFPSLFLQTNDTTYQPLTLSYSDADRVLQQITPSTRHKAD